MSAPSSAARLRSSPTLSHPLAGADLSTLVGALASGDRPSLRHAPLYGAFFGSALVRAPIDVLEAAIVAEGVAPRRLFSGAGHDAMALRRIADIAMLFVRCTDGISHNPAEAITAEDAGIAARVLLRFIRAFDPARAPARA